MRALFLESGQVFGRLTVLGLDEQSRYRKWMCKCVCGTVTSVTYGNLIHGNTTSCGCYWRSKMTAAGLQKRSIPWEADMLKYIRTLKKTTRRKTLAETWGLDLKEYVTLVTANCHYCGATPSQVPHGKGMDFMRRNGIDRKNPDEGYTRENCVPCCTVCNRAKLCMTSEEFEDLTRKQYLYLKAKGLITR